MDRKYFKNSNRRAGRKRKRKFHGNQFVQKPNSKDNAKHKKINKEGNYNNNPEEILGRYDFKPFFLKFEVIECL